MTLHVTLFHSIMTGRGIHADGRAKGHESHSHAPPRTKYIVSEAPLM